MSSWFLLACTSPSVPAGDPVETESDLVECSVLVSDPPTPRGDGAFFRDPVVFIAHGDDAHSAELVVERLVGDAAFATPGRVSSTEVSPGRFTWVFEPDRYFEPDTLYTARIAFCDGAVEYPTTFRTSHVGHPVDPSEALGTTWRLDYQEGEWFHTTFPPADGGDEEVVLSLVESANGVTWRLGYASPFQQSWSACYATTDMETDWSQDPWFAATAIGRSVDGDQLDLPILSILQVRCGLGLAPTTLEGCELTQWFEVAETTCDEFHAECEPCPGFEDQTCANLGAVGLPARPVAEPLPVITPEEAAACGG
ncbi:MAG: hypothetical protein H6737_12055 [Alphaproteobacteria bacterium]|nr:hypothetical protein [Alphaproteobacteria bacterium]